MKSSEWKSQGSHNSVFLNIKTLRKLLYTHAIELFCANYLLKITLDMLKTFTFELTVCILLLLDFDVEDTVDCQWYHITYIILE